MDDAIETTSLRGGPTNNTTKSGRPTIEVRLYRAAGSRGEKLPTLLPQRRIDGLVVQVWCLRLLEVGLIHGGCRNGENQFRQYHQVFSAGLAYAYAVSGQRAEALKELAGLKKELDQNVKMPMNIAGVYAGLGNKDHTLAMLERAYQHRYSLILSLKLDQRLENLHSDPRFKDLLRRIGLPEYGIGHKSLERTRAYRKVHTNGLLDGSRV